jgi:hypothetical protein
MSARTIVPPFRTISASKLVNAVAGSLTEIKREDDLTDEELGGFLGKGVDQGKKYRTGLAEMPMTSFLRGCERWNGRFANDVLALIGMKIVPLDSGGLEDRRGVTALMRAVLSLQEATEDDDQVDEVELAQRRALIEDAGQYIDQLRERLKLRAVA